MAREPTSFYQILIIFRDNIKILLFLYYVEYGKKRLDEDSGYVNPSKGAYFHSFPLKNKFKNSVKQKFATLVCENKLSGKKRGRRVFAFSTNLKRKKLSMKFCQS